MNERIIEDGNDQEIVQPVCNTCQHYRGGGTCPAFPERIHYDILRGVDKHRKIHPDQVGEAIYTKER